MNSLKLSMLLLLVLGISSCNKEEAASLEGEYTGKFFYYNTNPAANTLPPASGAVSISFSGNSYSSTGNQNRIPAGGSGTFSLNENTAKFQDMNVWTANFDGNLILTGEYKFETKSDSVILTKTVGFNNYSYRIKRTN